MINDVVYPDFTVWPSPQKPALRLNTVKPYTSVAIGPYEVLPVPMQHAVPTVGFQITGREGERVFFSGDTGPGLAPCWEYIAPQLMIIETALSNKSVDIASEAGHLYPSLLKEELISFRQIRGYLPKVIVTHMNPEVESEINEQIQRLAGELNAQISLAYEGMEI
ncbi:MAG: hypothetical protein R6U37_06195 [Dehalococcoidia bacterium]